MEASHKGGKSPRVEESTGAKPKASVSKALSPLKNGVARSASSHEGKELDLYGVTRKFRLDLKKLRCAFLRVYLETNLNVSSARKRIIKSFTSR